MAVARGFWPCIHEQSNSLQHNHVCMLYMGFEILLCSKRTHHPKGAQPWRINPLSFGNARCRYIGPHTLAAANLSHPPPPLTNVSIFSAVKESGAAHASGSVPLRRLSCRYLLLESGHKAHSFAGVKNGGQRV